MSSPTGIVPENLLHPAMKEQLVQWLVNAPYASAQKRALLRGAAMTMGIAFGTKDYNRVEKSGIDRNT